MEDEELSNSEVLRIIREHIAKLNDVSKRIQGSEYWKTIEQRWLNSEYPHQPQLSHPEEYFRGAGIKIFKSYPTRYTEEGKHWAKDAWDNNDEVCPSRFPTLLSGLISEIQEPPGKEFYLFGSYKWAFYDTILMSCLEFESTQSADDKILMCSTIIFNQIREMNTWCINLEKSIESPEISLLELGWSYYFAFGRNVNRTQMLSKERCPNAIFLGRAHLFNHRFAIDTRGYATVLPKENNQVDGVLWLISPDDESRLDLREGVRRHIYKKESMTVFTPGLMIGGGPQEVQTLVYVSNSPEGSKPKAGYIEQIIEGLVETLYSDEQLKLYRDYLSIGKESPETDSRKSNNKQALLNINKKEENNQTSNFPKYFLPENTSLPFFAYGLFKWGEFGHNRIKILAKHLGVEEAFAEGMCLLERDGLPLACQKNTKDLNKEIVDSHHDVIFGDLIEFEDGKGNAAYQLIAEIEPEHQYKWKEIEVMWGTKGFYYKNYKLDPKEWAGLTTIRANVLIAKSPNKGTSLLDNDEWRLEDDPFYSSVIHFAREVIETGRDTVQLQAAYLMVWTAIERIATLRISLKGEPLNKIFKLAKEKTFSDILDVIDFPDELRKVYDTRDLKSRIPEEGNHTKTVRYLYQIRSNISHRGKGGFNRDHELVEHCLLIVVKILKSYVGDNSNDPNPNLEN